MQPFTDKCIISDDFKIFDNRQGISFGKEIKELCHLTGIILP
jgi:hypothetical protein